MRTLFLQAFARLPEQTPPDSDNTDTVLLLIAIGTVVVVGIIGAVQVRLAYNRGYRDGLADGWAGEESAPVAPAIKVQPRPWRPRGKKR